MTVGATDGPCPNRIGKAYRYGNAPRGYQFCGITREWCTIDPQRCPVCFDPFGSWRSVVAGITAILADPVYDEAQAVIDGIGRIRDARLQPYARETALQMAVDALEYDRQVHYHDRAGNLLRAAGWARTAGRGRTGGADYLGGSGRRP